MPEEEIPEKRKTVWDLLLDSFDEQEQSQKKKLKGAI